MSGEQSPRCKAAISLLMFWMKSWFLFALATARSREPAAGAQVPCTARRSCDIPQQGTQFARDGSWDLPWLTWHALLWLKRPQIASPHRALSAGQAQPSDIEFQASLLKARWRFQAVNLTLEKLRHSAKLLRGIHVTTSDAWSKLTGGKRLMGHSFVTSWWWNVDVSIRSRWGLPALCRYGNLLRRGMWNRAPFPRVVPQQDKGSGWDGTGFLHCTLEIGHLWFFEWMSLGVSAQSALLESSNWFAPSLCYGFVCWRFGVAKETYLGFVCFMSSGLNKVLASLVLPICLSLMMEKFSFNLLRIYIGRSLIHGARLRIQRRLRSWSIDSRPDLAWTWCKDFDIPSQSSFSPCSFWLGCGVGVVFGACSLG